MASILVSSVNPFYVYSRSSQPFFQLHISLKEHFSNLLYDGDQTRLVYTQNDNALRKRQDGNFEDTNLFFPFMNYKRTPDFNPDPVSGRWNNKLYASGVYIDALGMKVKANPVNISFEGMIWLSTEQDLAETFRRLRMDADNFTELTYTVVINGVELPLNLELGYDTLQYDPEFTDRDWLEKNKIHTIRVDFSVNTFLIETVNPDDTLEYSITEKVIYDFKNKNCLGEITYEETIDWLIDEYDDVHQKL